MKICIIGESMTMPSGFGQQTKLLVEGLAEKGHDVYLLSGFAQKRFEETLPRVHEWQFSDLGKLDMWDRAIMKLRPDATIIFWSTYQVAELAKLKSLAGNCPTFFWLPWEGSTLPEGAKIAFLGVPKDRIIHLSEFARMLWSEAVKSDIVIPHGVDLEKFQRSGISKSELREKWAVKLRFPLKDDDLILLNVDRNIKHKRWDATFSLVKQLCAKTDKRVLLIAHTQKNVRGPVFPGFDLEQLVKLYDVSDSVVFTDFDWSRGYTVEELIQLYELCDYRISTSEGEGFGIPTIEAAALEVSQVLNSHTTMPELLPLGSPFLVSSSFAEMDRDTLWQVPDVRAMVSCILKLEGVPEVRITAVQEALAFVERFNRNTVIDKWNELLESSHHDNRDSYWYENRWGFFAGAQNLVTIRNLIEAVKIIAEGPILEIGAFTGMFVDFALEWAMDVVGIEPDPVAAGRARDKARAFIQVQSFAQDWPRATKLVLTDCLPLIVREGGGELLGKCLHRFKEYSWVFLRNNPTYHWKLPVVDSAQVASILEADGMVRRQDLEQMLKEKIAKELTHEIWSNNPDTSIVPRGVCNGDVR